MTNDAPDFAEMAPLTYLEHLRRLISHCSAMQARARAKQRASAEDAEFYGAYLARAKRRYRRTLADFKRRQALTKKEDLPNEPNPPANRQEEQPLTAAESNPIVPRGYQLVRLPRIVLK